MSHSPEFSPSDILKTKSSRRQFLRGAAAVTAGIALNSLPRIGVAQEQNAQSEQIIQPSSGLPDYISSPEMIALVSQDAAVLNANTESDQSDFNSKFFIYPEIPQDWIPQPGLTINADPADIFLGEHHYGVQTIVWAYAKPLEEFKTPEDYMDYMVEKLGFEQKLHHETQNPDSPYDVSYYAMPPQGWIEKVAGKEGWRAQADMLGKTNGSDSYFRGNLGFIEGDFAYHLNIISSAGTDIVYGPDGEYIHKFVPFVNATKPLPQGK